MQPAELLKYIENPRLLNRQSVKDLQKLVLEFPYFQPAHLLLSLAAKKWDASAYQQSLKKTAIVATSRSHLFNLIYELENDAITNEPFAKDEEAQSQLSIFKATEVSPKHTLEQKEEPTIIKKVKEIVAEKPLEIKQLQPTQDNMETLEKEIQNQVVNSFIEKEILKTSELHHPKQKQDPESFVAWLLLLKKNNGQTYQQIDLQVSAQKLFQKPSQKIPSKQSLIPLFDRKEKNRALIDKIIESGPGIIRNKEDQKFFTANSHAKESLLENEHLVTETLAKIYALQGSVNKAVRAYEILSLKFPQKSAYFATLIKNLKSNT